MEVIPNLKATSYKIKGSIITIGTFDGIHLGHQEIIKKIIKEAKKTHITSVIVTLNIHPLNLLNPGETPRLLTSLPIKQKLLSQLGIDVMAIIDFNNYIANMPPEKFFNSIILNKLHPKKIIVGNDFKFGKNRKGDIKLLRALSRKYDFSTEFIPIKKKFDNKISSRYIRKILWHGEVVKVSKLLGRLYTIEGKITRGKGLGKKIGIPTANIIVSPEIILPQGVFAVKAYIGKKEYNGVTYIGFKPTFSKKTTKKTRKITVETHLVNFNKNILGKKLKISFIQKLRKEISFQSAETLKNKIYQDILKAQKYYF